ncbi:phosphatidylserine decarboxylase-domain-containing protein [Vararia minispora EC-137]|uniref:Phosphatidylserine decarboxylase-domain-containing protein n=1 Tax=Vararia minispora EC-137 TaxID=1314806 RepID=A0ACB8QU55_9AGAM|nr:phosphatidylserine decarboxylase-domain-containing protein [Vararia minispora EC-137]
MVATKKNQKIASGIGRVVRTAYRPLTRVTPLKNGSRITFAPVLGEVPIVLLRVQVLCCEELLAKDRSGSSDPFVVVSLLGTRNQTPVVKRSTNPVWSAKDATFDIPIYLSLADKLGALELVVWDKDMLKKEYLGESALPLEDWFKSTAYAFDDPENELITCAIVSTRANTTAAGYIRVKLGFVNPPGVANLADFGETFEELVRRSRPSLVSAPPKRIRTSWAQKRGDYDLNASKDVVGIIMLEIKNAQDLPKLKNMTRTGWDMDPFVVISFSKKVFRTRVIRHCLNPVWNEKLLFHVRKYEKTFSVQLAVLDWDKISSNDRVGEASFDLSQLMANVPEKDPVTGLYPPEEDGTRSFVELSLPLQTAKDSPWEAKHNPTITVRAKYQPYDALRQRFWYQYVKQYDTDDTEALSHLELTSMLDSLGSTLSPETISSFWTRNNKAIENEDELTFAEAIIALEAEIMRPTAEKKRIDPRENEKRDLGLGTSATGTPNPQQSTPSSDAEESGSSSPGSDEYVERVINVKNCPLCHRPRMNSKAERDIVTHLAVCASSDWKRVDRMLVGNFVTASQAQRKWYTRMFSKGLSGDYKLGANSANIIVQNRMTGQLEEEKMQVYVRLGIRLLYKGARSRLEGARARRLLKSMSIKQGVKYDSPDSVSDIRPFIEFHNLNTEEIELPLEAYKTFNEFFYRKLKSSARPVECPDDPNRIVSAADCRLMAFESVNEATKLWIKGKEFSVGRLLGEAYKSEAERYSGGALVIFRLAPQDYHRFHSPVNGTVGPMSYISGEYYTVNPQAIRTTLDVYGENARKIVPIDSPQFGRVMAVCVGAMMVGSIKTTVKEGDRVRRGQEFGYFAFGGSTIVLLFEPGVVEWDEDLLINGRASLETLVRVGMGIGWRKGTKSKPTSVVH